MEAISPFELVKLAKKQLGLQPYAAVRSLSLNGEVRLFTDVWCHECQNSLVPNAYLDELKFHLSLYQHDSNVSCTTLLW